MQTTALQIFNQTVQFEMDLIWVKPLCDFFNLNVQFQSRKLKNDPILSKLWTKTSRDLGEIDPNGRILLSKKGFIRWIQTINPNTIDKKLHHLAFQRVELLLIFIHECIHPCKLSIHHFLFKQK